MKYKLKNPRPLRKKFPYMQKHINLSPGQRFGPEAYWNSTEIQKKTDHIIMEFNKNKIVFFGSPSNWKWTTNDLFLKRIYVYMDPVGLVTSPLMSSFSMYYKIEKRP